MALLSEYPTVKRFQERSGAATVGTPPPSFDAEADLQAPAESHTWLGFLTRERNLAWALLRRKIRFEGSPRLLLAFGKCFPS